MDDIQLIQIEKSELKSLITLSFEGDNELLDIFHIKAPATLDECVNNTFSFIENNKDFYAEDMKIFKLIRGMEAIGFTVIIENEHLPNELYSFGIKKEYRTWDITSKWMELLQKILGVPYYIILWSRNTRAINFFERNGFITEERNDLKKLIIKV